MGITLQAYRSTIGSFNGCTKHGNMNKFPSKLFFDHSSYTFEYGINEWSNKLYRLRLHAHVVRSRQFCLNAIAVSLVINILLCVANDVEKNPGPNERVLDISICHANIRSLKGQNKMLNISTEFSGNFDIITLSETWLSNRDDSMLFQIAGYQKPFRRDRSQGLEGYGGVLAWVSNNIACKRRKDLEFHNIEAMWLEIRMKNNKFLLCTIYRPPNAEEIFWEMLQENLDYIKQTCDSKVMLIGDFNADPQTREGIQIQNFADVNNLTLHINLPTRVNERSSSILDQCLTNFPNYVKDVDIFPPVSTNDHSTVVVNCRFQKIKS